LRIELRSSHKFAIYYLESSVIGELFESP
jgi:hypothetical protein